jgi:hypothetical protein
MLRGSGSVSNYSAAFLVAVPRMERSLSTGNPRGYDQGGKPATAFLFNLISRQQLSGTVAWPIPN